MKAKQITASVLLLFSMGYSERAEAQNILNDTLRVGTESLVGLAFSSQPNGVMPEGDGSYEVGGGSKKSLTLKALKPGAKDQVLLVTEGSRKHEFVLVYQEKAPPLQLDWSNMRELKKYVKAKKDKADKALAETNQIYERGNHKVALERYSRLYYDMEDPDRSFIKTRIGECEKALAILNQKIYKEEMAKGMAFAAKKQHREAVTAFGNALKNNPSDTAAKSQLEKSNSLWFEDRVKSAQNAFREKNYIQAKGAYEEAREINPSEFTQKHVTAYNKTLTPAKDQEFQQYKEKGDLALSVRNLNEAKGAYEAALRIKPTNAYCSDKMKEWAKLNNAAIEKEKKETEYYTLLYQAKRQASLASTTREYDQAIEMYQKASKLFAKRQFPKDRIAELSRMKKSVAVAGR